VIGNRLSGFEKTALSIKNAFRPVTVQNNVAFSKNAKDEVFSIIGDRGVVENNQVVGDSPR